MKNLLYILIPVTLIIGILLWYFFVYEKKRKNPPVQENLGILPSLPVKENLTPAQIKQQYLQTHPTGIVEEQINLNTVFEPVSYTDDLKNAPDNLIKVLKLLGYTVSNKLAIYNAVPSDMFYKIFASRFPGNDAHYTNGGQTYWFDLQKWNWFSASGYNNINFNYTDNVNCLRILNIIVGVYGKQFINL